MPSKTIRGLTDEVTTFDGSCAVEVEKGDNTSGYMEQSVIKNYIDASANPTGAILPFGGISTPTGYLLCDGSSVSMSTYAALWAVLSADKGAATITIATPGVVSSAAHGLITGDVVSFTTTGALPTGLTASTNYYVVYVDAGTFSLATTYSNAIAGTKIATSGSQSGTHTLTHHPYGIASATNFTLPDLRAAFPRGAGTSTAFTADVTVPQGSYLDDKLQGHWHRQLISTAGSISTGANPAQSPNATRNSLAQSDINITEIVTDGVNGTPRIGTETAPKSVGVNYIIKY